jgi:putative sterol carrier protein
MKDKGYGRILLTTSASGLYGNFGQSNYAAAKMALIGLMNALKLEGRKYDIKVNSIAPVAASRLTADILPPDLGGQVKPELVAPLALYLCSQRCPVSGNIYNAGMGTYNRVAVVSGSGVVLGGDEELPTPEQIRDGWEQIGSLGKGEEFADLTAQIGALLSAFERPTEAAAGAAARFAAAAEVFERMPGTFIADAAGGVDVVFQYHIAGEGGGDWHCIIKDRTCSVSAGVHDRPSCSLQMQAADFLDMMNGRLPPMQAYTSGKLKIGGDVMKSQLIEKLFKLR